MSLILSGAKFSTGAKWVGVVVMCFGMASCATTTPTDKSKPKRNKEYFSEKEYGVRASPRVANGANVPQGGGRFMVGQPYQVKGQTYVPKEDFGYNKTGLASWYGSAFHGRLTANGEVYDQQHLSAAHPTFPLPSYARVTNVDTGNSVIVRVNDRGPFHPGRIIDVSDKSAEMLDIKRTGTANVRVQYVGRAPLEGHDMPYLMASYIKKGDRYQNINPGGQIASGVMVASNGPMTRDQIPNFSNANPNRTVPAQVNRAAMAAAPVSRTVAIPRTTGNAVASIQPARDTGSSQTSYAGSTPSSIPFQVLQNTGAAQAFEAFIELPQIGPLVRERPDMNLRYASAYAEQPVAKAHPAFDAVMVRNDGLTQGSIQAAAAKRQGAGQKRDRN
jgi:rare lipoprotein A